MKFMAAGMTLLTAGISSGVGAEQAVHGPVAVYWMSAATTSGIMGSMMGGSSPGGRPDARSMMGRGNAEPQDQDQPPPPAPPKRHGFLPNIGDLVPIPH